MKDEKSIQTDDECEAVLSTGKSEAHKLKKVATI